MPLNKIQMKFINSRIIFIFLYFNTTIIAQEIIRDTVVAPVKKVKTNQRQKIDGIIATVGDLLSFGFRYRQVLFGIV
jgi:peptidyl-prolyl cis-trans isomerase SurA